MTNIKEVKYLGKAMVEVEGFNEMLEIKLTRVDIKNDSFSGVVSFGGTLIEIRKKETNNLTLSNLQDLDLTPIYK